MADKYTSVKAAIEAVCGGCNEDFENEPCEPSECSIRERLNAIPVADVVERRRGEWKILDECSNEGVYCSVCHKKVYRIDYSNTMKLRSNFCPNCGADMRGDADGG